MKDHSNIYVDSMMKSLKNRQKNRTTCQRAESGGEPVRFMNEESFWRFCNKSSGRGRGQKKMDMGIRHAVHDDCRFCPLAGGKKGLPDNVRMMEVAA